MLQRRRYVVLIALLALIGPLAGCKKDAYPKVTASFADAVTQHSGALKRLYQGVNDSELSVYEVNHLTNPPLNVADNEICLDDNKQLRRQPSVMLAPAFSPAQIQQRVGLVSLLGNYAASLADLASGTAPQDIGSKLSDLQKTLAQTAKDSGGSSKDLAITGPLATIGSVIGKLYLERRRTEKLSTIIVRYAPTVDTLLMALDSDATATHKLAVANANDEYTSWLAYYNALRTLALPNPQRVRTFRFHVDTCAPGPTPSPPPPRPVAAAAAAAQPAAVPPPVAVSPLPPTWCQPVPTPAPLVLRRKPPTPPPAEVAVNVRADARYLDLRRTVLRRALDAHARYVALTNAPPHDSICSLWAAHQKLVAFAQAPDRPESAQAFLQAVAEYRADAQKLSDAYHSLTTGG